MCVVFEIDEIDLVHDVVVGSKACAPRDARARQRHATPINQTDGVHRSEYGRLPSCAGTLTMV